MVCRPYTCLLYTSRGYSNRQALACLLHDASECYMSDVPRPLKQEMPRYREVEEQLLQVIYKKFLGSSLTDEEAQRLKEIDDDLLWYDLEVLLEEKQPGDAPKLHFELDYTCLLYTSSGERLTFGHNT